MGKALFKFYLITIILLFIGCTQPEKIENMDDVYDMIAEDEGISTDDLFGQYDENKRDDTPQFTAKKTEKVNYESMYWEDGKLSQMEYFDLEKKGYFEKIIIDESNGGLFGSGFSGMAEDQFWEYWDEEGELDKISFYKLHGDYKKLKNAPKKELSIEIDFEATYWEDEQLSSVEYFDLVKKGLVEKIIIDESNGGLLGNGFVGMPENQFWSYWGEEEVLDKNKFNELYQDYEAIKNNEDNIVTKGEGLNIEIVGVE